MCRVLATFILAGSMFALSATPSTARVLHVPSEYGSIGAGLDDAEYGDTVLVASGTYNEFSLDLRPGVELRSESGAETTIIDGSGGGIEGVILFIRDGDSRTKLRGFTLRNSWFGIVLISSAPVVAENIFTGVMALAIITQSAQPLIQHNLFLHIGGGVEGQDEGDVISVIGNTFVEVGEAIDIGLNSTDAVVQNNIVKGGDYGVVCIGAICETVTVECNDVWGQAISDYYGWSVYMDPLGRDGNFSADPLFCGDGDYSLDALSPCLPGQHPDGAACGLIGAFDRGCGSTSSEPATWGKVKAILYR